MKTQLKPSIWSHFGSLHWGVVLYRLGKNVGRRINCLQKIHRSIRVARQEYRKTCCSLRLDKHKGTGQLRVAPKSKMKGFKNPNENPTQTFDLEPLWKPSWGGVLYRLGKNVGRRINCSQKCGKTARWHQKLWTFGALARWWS